MTEEMAEAMTEEPAEEEVVAWYDSGVVWYGALRAGIQSAGGNISVEDGVSLWGITGTVDAGDGLTAFYRFEQGISTQDASQSGRHAHVGLGGAFGTVTLGQFSAASGNVLSALDKSFYYGSKQATARHGNAVSYAFTNDLMALQVDAVYGQGADEDDPTKDLEKVEFGLSVNLGDLGKVAFATVDDKYKFDDNGNDDDADDSTWRTKTTTVAAEVSVSGLTAYVGSQTEKSLCTGYGTTSCDQSSAGQVDTEAKTTFFGFGGSLGDTGANYRFQWRDKKNTNKTPWVLSLSQNLGASTTIVFEHGNYDRMLDDDGDVTPNKTQLGLQVAF